MTKPCGATKRGARPAGISQAVSRDGELILRQGRDPVRALEYVERIAGRRAHRGAVQASEAAAGRLLALKAGPCAVGTRGGGG